MAKRFGAGPRGASKRLYHDDVGMALERELTMEGGAQSFEDTDPDADLDYVDIDKAREARRRN